MLTLIGALIVLVVWIGVGFMVLSAVRGPQRPRMRRRVVSYQQASRRGSTGS